MSRIGPPDRLTRLLNIIGAEKVGNRNRKSGSRAARSAPGENTFLSEIRTQLVSDLSAIKTDSEEGRRQARKLLVHRLVSNRLRHLELQSTQVSHIAQRVLELSRDRPEIQQLIAEVIDELAPNPPAV